MTERLRCDLCNAPWNSTMQGWTYTTPNPSADMLLADTASSSGTKQSLFYAEDEQWLVCLDCHLLIEEDDAAGLLSRSLHVQREQGVLRNKTSIRMMENEIARIHALFWEHKSPLPPVPEPGNLP